MNPLIFPSRIIQIFSCNVLFIGVGLAWISPENVSLDIRCSYEARLLVSNAGQAASSGKVLIDSLVLAPAIEGMAVYLKAGT